MLRSSSVIIMPDMPNERRWWLLSIGGLQKVFFETLEDRIEHRDVRRSWQIQIDGIADVQSQRLARYLRRNGQCGKLDVRALRLLGLLRQSSIGLKGRKFLHALQRIEDHRDSR